tara:strand:+ start:3090 stop:3287 length:198 start_codon:yes stop_codon:yes gene_type:complete
MNLIKKAIAIKPTTSTHNHCHNGRVLASGSGDNAINKYIKNFIFCFNLKYFETVKAISDHIIEAA